MPNTEPMITIEATIPCLTPPAWAVLERKLFEVLDQAVYPYLKKYTDSNSYLIWGGHLNQRDDADDFYEAFSNWPLLYLLGGGDHLLELAHRQWEAVTDQLTELGSLSREYVRCTDQFHQSESYTYFYLLCLADPTNSKLAERARRFADFYTGSDPATPNYDPTLKIIRSSYNGSEGPGWGYFEQGRVISYPWRQMMQPYGLPFEDVPGVTSYDDLKDQALAAQMGGAMQERFGKGDSVGNLLATSLVTNAYLMTGKSEYKQWVQEYVDSWVERSSYNNGILPDNVGLSGQVGEYLNGRWYGGFYGWSWPHGFYSVEMSAIVAAANALLLTGKPEYLELPRNQLDWILAQGVQRDITKEPMTLAHHFVGQFEALLQQGQTETLLVPYRYSDSGFFDYHPLTIVYPAAIWNLSQSKQDWERLATIRKQESYDWRRVVPFRNKEDSGHEQPWLRFLAGDNPAYPVEILSQAYGQVGKRVAQIWADQTDLTHVPDELVGSMVHHWQNHNPVTTEALIQLTLGAPQPVYNGGLLMCAVRYFDVFRQRPGLPSDVAALVENLEGSKVVVKLINLNLFETRELILQAGAFGEHQIMALSYLELASEYPAVASNKFTGAGSFGLPSLEYRTQHIKVNATYLKISLLAGREITLDLEIARFVNSPSYKSPFHQASVKN